LHIGFEHLLKYWVIHKTISQCKTSQGKLKLNGHSASKRITGPSIKFTWHSPTPQRRCSGFYWSFVPVTNHLLLDHTMFYWTLSHVWQTLGMSDIIQYILLKYTQHIYIWKKIIMEGNSKFSKITFWVRTHSVLVIGLYELLGNPTSELIEPPGPILLASALLVQCKRPVLMVVITWYVHV
jgi:hypothetical protein